MRRYSLDLELTGKLGKTAIVYAEGLDIFNAIDAKEHERMDDLYLNHPDMHIFWSPLSNFFHALREINNRTPGEDGLKQDLDSIKLAVENVEDGEARIDAGVVERILKLMELYLAFTIALGEEDEEDVDRLGKVLVKSSGTKTTVSVLLHMMKMLSGHLLIYRDQPDFEKTINSLKVETMMGADWRMRHERSEARQNCTEKD